MKDGINSVLCVGLARCSRGPRGGKARDNPFLGGANLHLARRSCRRLLRTVATQCNSIQEHRVENGLLLPFVVDTSRQLNWVRSPFQGSGGWGNSSRRQACRLLYVVIVLLHFPRQATLCCSVYFLGPSFHPLKS